MQNSIPKIIPHSQNLPETIIYKSSSMEAVIRLISEISESEMPVLITGESGTGKGMIARLIHKRSRRFQKPFVIANISSYQTSVLESELFGHLRGSFTGANKGRQGLFIRADGGTLFLDEIGETPLETQLKILGAVEEKFVWPVGSDNSYSANARIITATNCDLEEKIAQGLFRKDFFYRIGTFRINIPALRDRPEDIIPIAKHFIFQECQEIGRTPPEISSRASGFLLEQFWEGNVRELRSVVTSALPFVKKTVEKESFSFYKPLCSSFLNPKSEKLLQPKGSQIEKREREIIIEALERCLWVQKSAAKILGISARALNYKIKKYGLSHERWRKNK